MLEKALLIGAGVLIGAALFGQQFQDLVKAAVAPAVHALSLAGGGDLDSLTTTTATPADAAKIKFLQGEITRHNAEVH